MQSRRFFLKNGLAVIAAAGLAKTSEAAASSPAPKWAMIIDVNRCTGCQSCVIACKAQNKTTADRFNTRLLSLEDGNYPDVRVVFTPVQCNQCENPQCVPACPLGATFKLANGIVVTDWDNCEGLGNCVRKCPYGARFLDERHGSKADKCDFCLNRIEKSLLPACAESCASNARLFGDLNAPTGEFAAYLKRKELRAPKPELGIKTSVLYLPSRTGKKGGSL